MKLFGCGELYDLTMDQLISFLERLKSVPFWILTNNDSASFYLCGIVPTTSDYIFFPSLA